MKKMFFVVAFAAASFAAKAQDAPTNVVKLNPLGLIFGSANLAYEKALNEKSSFLIAPQFGGFKLGGVKYSSFGLGAEYRFFLSNTKSAPEGFYAGPGLAFNSGKVKYEGFEDGDEKVKFSSFGGKVIIGNQWIFDSGFTIDLNGGISFQKFSYKDGEEDSFGLKGSGVLPALGFSIGYAF